MSQPPTPSTHPLPVLPPSPSWRSVLHPNRHIGRSVQYRRGESLSHREGKSRSNEHSTLLNHRWSSSIAPTETSSQRLPKNQQRQSQDDSHYYLPPFSSSASRMLHSNNLSSSPPSPDRFRRSSSNINSSRSNINSSNRQPPPFLIIALLKLTEVLPIYCQLLATGPSYTNASRACAILDGVVATATTSPSNSPVIDKRSTSPHQKSPLSFHPSHSHQRPISPLTLQYWMSKQSPLPSLHSPTASALAMEGEWGALVAPFLLFAAAEAMTADLEHLRTPATTPSDYVSTPNTTIATAVALTALYQRISQEFQRVREVLCEPFLRSSEPMTTTTTSSTLQHHHSHAAATLAVAIQSLVVAIAIRCQMIDLQASLFGGTSATEAQERDGDGTGHNATTGLPTLSEASIAVSLYLESIEMACKRTNSGLDVPANDTCTDANEARPLVGPIFQNMSQELKAWKFCLETIAALDQCRFLETIIHLRQWQLHLPSGTSRLGQWMQISFQETISLLPIYFDRVHAFATPLYGFDTAAIWQQQPPPPPPPQRQGSSRNLGSSGTKTSTNLAHRTDWNAVITEFLRRQDKLGGPPMAVALVLNAVETANLHVERGFRFSTADADIQIEHDVKVRWPAIYLRSTMHLSSSLHSSRSSPHNSGVMRISQSSMLSNWSTSGTSSTGIGSSSPFVIGGRKRPSSASSPVSSQRKGGIGATVQEHHFSVLEYAPDTGIATSWPHSDWDLLASTLENVSQTENPTSGDIERVSRYMEEDDDTSDAMGEDPALSMFAVSLPVHTSRFLMDNGIKTFGRQSTFHVIGIGAWLHLVVFVKDKEDDSRWHRRKTGLDDNEIQAFLLDILKPKLSAMGILSSPKRTSVLELALQDKRLVLPSSSGTSWANETTVQEFLTNVKQVFGLRPVSPFAKDATRSFSFYTPRSPRNAMKHRSERLGWLPKRQTPHDESAAAFFLGPDLASSIECDCKRFAASLQP